MKHSPFLPALSCCLTAVSLLSGLVPAQESEASPMRKVQSLPLSGVRGRLDHFTIDRQHKRIIFSCLDNSTVQIVDAFDGSRIHQIQGLSQPRGTFYLAEGDKLYVANGAGGRVNVYDGMKFTLITAIDFGKDPDTLRFDAAAKRLYVGYGAGAIGVIDVMTNKRLDIDYKLEGHPADFQLATKTPQIFVNVAGKKDIAVVDRATGKVTDWALPADLSANSPLELDEVHRRVLIGSRMPSHLIVLNMDTRAVVANLPLTGDIDGIFYDAERKRVYVAGGEGILSVFQQTGADRYSDMGKYPSAVGARTGVWYANRDQLYIAAPSSGTIDARLLVFEAQNN
ncbi:MAG TPA: hypothetical protein VEU11_12060 [Terriglobales bacterium]|nr:hypothetical protein [Terriglobales bacterium]